MPRGKKMKGKEQDINGNGEKEFNLKLIFVHLKTQLIYYLGGIYIFVLQRERISAIYSVYGRRQDETEAVLYLSDWGEGEN